MNSARQVDEQIRVMKNDGWCNRDIVWWTARLCEGWPYVFGAWGAYCTTTERKKRYKPDHDTIYSKCQVLRDKNPKSSCDGCQWFPNGERVRCYDCRGFTDWCLLQVGIDLVGEGATSQWSSNENWTQKGEVKDGIPENVLVCLFKADGAKMAHTGFGLNGETVECSNGVEYHEKMSSKWTHWAIPAGISADPVPPAPVPPEPEPTPEGYAVVTGKNVALRLGPDTGCKVLLRVKTGETVKITPPPADWEHVKYKDKEGYMMKAYIREGSD